jgi:hypothetical protein
MWQLRALLSGVVGDLRGLVALVGVLALVMAPRLAHGSHVVPDLTNVFEGFGANTAGGPGNNTVHVTTLADSVSPVVPGSLRDALSQGSRYIVFDVAGDIVLQGPLWVKKPFITIDGFTAPAPGITLVGQALAIRGPHPSSSDNGHDVIVRGLRVRDSVEDNFQVAYGAYNIVFDHVSSAGAGDGTLDVTFDSHDVTVSWSILALPASGKSVLIKYGASRVTLHHNLFVRGNQRNPAAAVDDDGTPATDTTVDMRNNLVWGWINYGTMIHHGARGNVVANLYSAPAASNSVQKQAVVVCRGAGDCFADLPAVSATSAAEGFVQDNLSGDPITIDINAERTTTTPFTADPVTMDDPCLAARRVLMDAGVRPLDARDGSLLVQIGLPVCTTTGVLVASSPNPSGFTAPVTLTAAVVPQVPTGVTIGGTVRFLVGSTLVGSAPVVGGTAAVTTSLLPAGRHDVVAVYDGDEWFQPASSLSLAQTVLTDVPTTTQVVASANPTWVGQPVTLTATVQPLPPSVGPATGTVKFRDGSSVLATVPLVGGVATLTTSALGAGWRTLTGTYSGDVNFGASTSAALSLAVDGGTTIALSAAPPSARAGQPVTLTATVTPVLPGAGTPTGMVSLKDGSAALVSLPLSGGVASFSTSALAIKSHSLTAQYAGDGLFSPSASSALTVTVSKGGTLTALASSAALASVTAPVTLTATVLPASPAGGTPGGSVKFKDGSTTIGTATLVNGVASLSALLAGGFRNLTAAYAGDTRYSTSTSAPLVQSVQGASSVTLGALLNPSTVGQTVTFGVAVIPTPPAAGLPTGTVTFRDGSTVLGSKPIVAGLTALTVSGLAARSHSITATYEGDGVYARTTSATLSQSVRKGSTTTTLSTSSTTAPQGQGVTFTAVVQPVAPASGTPEGTVKFSAGSTTLGTIHLSAGTAHLTTTLAVGHHHVTATYLGNGDYTWSVSPSITQDITSP